MLKSKSIRTLLFCGIGLFLLVQSCKNDDNGDATPNAVNLSEITSLNAQDIGDAMNGTDLQISFSKVADESNILGYRVFVVNSSESSAFDLNAAENVSSDHYLMVNKMGANISQALSIDAKTTSEQLITNDAPYVVFVMTVTADPMLYNSVLSNASGTVTLTTIDPDKVKVTYIANDGIMIEHDGKKVVIDAINRAGNLTGWISPSSAALMAVENGDPPYDDIDVIMITHNHSDHYATSAVQNYLSAHPNTKLIVPASMRGSFGAFGSQVVDVSLNKFERVNVVENGIGIDVLRVEHFDQFAYDFSTLESYTYVIEMAGKKFMHTGDIDYVDSQLDVFNLLADDVTVVFIPTFGTLVTAENRDALVDNVAPENIVCLHLLSSGLITTLGQISDVYPMADVFRTPLETRLY